jgi:hypothetical protein
MVKVFENQGVGKDATLLCGLDWLQQHSGTIKVTSGRVAVRDPGVS